MIKFTTGFLLAVLLLSGKVAWAEEKSSEHQKNISKAVSAQLLRMKLKKMGKIKADEKTAKDLKLLPETSDLKAEDKKPDNATTQQQSEQQPVTTIKSDAGKKSLVPAVKKETKKSEKNEEKQKKIVKTEEEKSKKPLSSQQKNDNLRLKLQDLINSTPDN